MDYHIEICYGTRKQTYEAQQDTLQERIADALLYIYDEPKVPHEVKITTDEQRSTVLSNDQLALVIATIVERPETVATELIELFSGVIANKVLHG